MRAAERCSVHVVTWNSSRHLPAFFRTLDDQGTREFTVTLVDNASEDRTAEWVKQHQPDTVLLRNFRNQGFAKAHNQAITLAWSRWSGQDLSSRYVLIANPDMWFDPDAVSRMMSFLDEHPDVAACAPKLLRMTPPQDPDDPFSVERTNIIDALGLTVRKSRRVCDRAAGEEDGGQYDSPHEVFGFSGACMMVRASVLQDVAENGKVFDEDFFAYKEDIDLAWRLRTHGHRSFVVPSAVVWHERGTPSSPKRGWFSSWTVRRKRPSIVNFYSTRNHGLLLAKNDDFVNILLHAPWIFPYEAAKFVANTCSPTGIRAEFASLAALGRMLKKRRATSTERARTRNEVRQWFV